MGTKRWREAGRWVLGLVAALMLAGCAPGPVTPPIPFPTPQEVSPMPTPQQLPSPAIRDVSVTPTPLPIPPDAREVVERAQSDLAQRLGVSTTDVVVTDLEAVEWPDASLGCPQPGMMYAQVVTPGYRIILEVGGESYEYHSGWGGHVVHCPDQERPSPQAPVPDEAGQVVERARAELAAELGVSQDAISVVAVEPVEWRDSSLGCPQPGEMYLQVITPGYRIVLQKGDQVFTYHSDRGRRVVRCEKPRPEPPVRLPVSLLRANDEPAEAARRDLAARLGAPEASVSVVSDTLREVSTQELEACYGTSLPSGLSRAAGTGRDIILVVHDTKYRYLVVGRFLIPCWR